jgi:NAD(P)-dependent dehydrogenase (short-subunit alcohol dehydrogenase family)
MAEGRALDGKVAVVTGGSRGIGKQACVELARLGAAIVIAARTDEPRERTPGTLHETAEAVRETGGDALVVRTDLAQQADLDHLVAATLDRHGGIDILVNNAAYTFGRALWAHVPELTREQWEHGLAVNLTAPLMLISGFWASMIERGGGRVVNVTSGAASLQPLDQGVGLAGTTMPENGPLYGSSKAGLNRMANVVAREGQEHDIAVINLEPGFVLTETMELTFKTQGVEGAGAGANPPAVPAKVIAYLCTCDEPMQYSGQVLHAPRMYEELGL